MSSAPSSDLRAEHARLMLGPRTAAERRRLALLDDYLRACAGREPVAVPTELALRRPAMNLVDGDPLGLAARGPG